jgi:hypothetical protein
MRIRIDLKRDNLKNNLWGPNMKIVHRFFHIFLITFGIAFLGAYTPAHADVLGISAGYPQVVTDSGGVCSYSAGTSTLTLTGVPTFIYFDSAQSNVSFVDVGTVTLSANINNSGTLVGGTFTLDGETTDFNTSDFFMSPLLTGTIVAYGIAAPGTSDLVDFRIQPTGGSLIVPRFATGDQIAVRVSLQGSTFNGSFAADWGCDRNNFIIGPTPPLVQESCAVTLTKTANPTTIGPITRRSGHDKEGDSDDDNDDNGYGYSRDDDDASIACGCRGKASELTFRYNGLQPAEVKVSRSAPYSVALYQGTVQPGGQFTVLPSDYGPEGFRGTLGTSIEIAVNGGEAVKVETSGAKDIGPGLVAGDFEVMSGKSRKLHKPLCPMPGSGCPANQQVTYTYTLANSGSGITNLTLDDDKLGNILTGGTLASGQSATFTKTACLSHTTTNTATAMGSLLSGAHCSPTPATATVTLLMPPPDCNAHHHDCDPDSTPPPPPPGHGGCSNDYWKGHKHMWTKSFKQSNKFGALFQVDSAGNRSLSDTLDINGGGAKALGREAAAALLNASDPNVNYIYTPAEVKSMVQDAYRTKDYTTTTDLLKQHNNSGCPLGN